VVSYTLGRGSLWQDVWSRGGRRGGGEGEGEQVLPAGRGEAAGEAGEGEKGGWEQEGMDLKVWIQAGSDVDVAYCPQVVA
jgi:hypothetical protein